MVSPLLLIAAACLFRNVRCLDNGLALTPPMGWMSWTAFYCEMNCTAFPNACINQQLYMQMADRLAEDGYREAGYVRVHVDDCWMDTKRSPEGLLQSDPDRFPDGMHALANYVQNKGLLFGIYEDYGTETCGGFPGSFGYLKTDADTFAAWEVDYLKLDGCNVDIAFMPFGYPSMERALNATGRPIMYSCSWPAYYNCLSPETQALVNYNEIRASCNLWRNYYDISSHWSSIRTIIMYYDKMQDKHIPTHGPGGWHDPDMIVIGNAGITVDMAISQMTIWSIWSAPLIMSNDLRTIGDEFKAILLNKDVIAIDQDPMGRMGRLVRNDTWTGIYVKEIMPSTVLNGKTYYSYAIAVLNRNENTTASVSFTYGDFGFDYPNGYVAKELWTNQDLGTITASDSYTVALNPAGSSMIRAVVSH